MKKGINGKANYWQCRAGDSRSYIAGQIVKMAGSTSTEWRAEFNGVDMIARPGEATKEVEDRFIADMKEVCKPIDKRVRAEAREAAKKIQQKVNKKVELLADFDFSNLGALVHWLEEIQALCDHIYVTTPYSQIIDIFTQHGFDIVDGNNTEIYPESWNKEEYSRWIIGMVLGYFQSEVTRKNRGYYWTLPAHYNNFRKRFPRKRRNFFWDFLK